MFLSKKKNGIYYIYLDQPNGKRTSKSTGAKYKSEALKFLNNFNSAVIQPQLSKTSLKKFCWEYLKHSESQHTVKTTKTYETTFKFLQDFLGNIDLNEITSLQLSKFIQKRATEVSLYAARKDLINIKSAFNWAIKMEFLNSNPSENIKRIIVPERQPTFFSKTEIEKLLSIVNDEQFKNLIEIAVNTGLRLMELLTLEWNQVNFEDNTIILTNQTHITKGKKIRSIPLNIRALQILTELEQRKESEFVFSDNKQKLTPDYVTKKFKKYVIKAEINPKLHFHSLRHSFASWLVQKGVSIYHVSKLLGHADIKTTQIYAHLKTDDLRESINLLNN